MGARAAAGMVSGLILVLLLVTVGVAAPAAAHQDGCHRWHSCPSDTGSYQCGDGGYACRYPTYPESQRGLIEDPTYEDYGFTDRGAPDYDYGYSDQCPQGGCAWQPRAQRGATASVGGGSGALSPGATEPYDYTPMLFLVALGGAVILIIRTRGARVTLARAGLATTPIPPMVSVRNAPSAVRRPPPATKRSHSSAGPHPTDTRCRCGGRFVARRNSSTGGRFYGCSRYPQCRATRSVRSLG